MNDLENEYVTDRMGTVWRAIDVFKIGETQGTRNERQRIIKLLETYDADLRDDLIALIKGEQK